MWRWRNRELNFRGGVTTLPHNFLFQSCCRVGIISTFYSIFTCYDFSQNQKAFFFDCCIINFNTGEQSKLKKDFELRRLFGMLFIIFFKFFLSFIYGSLFCIFFQLSLEIIFECISYNSKFIT